MNHALNFKQICFLLLAGAFITACNRSGTQDNPRRIEVIGTAEKELVPDLIYVSLSLKEYKNSQTKQLVPITVLEQQLVDGIKKAGIEKNDLMIDDMNSESYWWRRKNPGFMASKQYKLKLSDLSKMDEITKGIDPMGIEQTSIDSYDHTQLTSFKKGLKIKALEAAREKARYLAAVVNDSLGAAIQIEEVQNDFTAYPPLSALANTVEAVTSSNSGERAGNLGFHSIRLNYSIRAIFELKKN
jgi:uncharacterized protein YggE